MNTNCGFVEILRLSRRKALLVFAVAVALTATALLAPTAQSAPSASVTALTWDVIGLDSNKPATSGPSIFPVGARICQSGAEAGGDVTATLTLTGSLNPYISITGPSVIEVGTLTSDGDCVDAYFNVAVARNSSAVDTTQTYSIALSGEVGGVDSGLAAARSGKLYVESLVSQNRNQIKKVSTTGPTTCGPMATPTDPTYASCATPPSTATLGQVLDIYVYASSSTQYEEIQAYMTFPGTMFRVISADSKVSAVTAPAQTTSQSMWNDACSWTYATPVGTSGSCTTAGKAGNDIVTHFKVEIIGSGSSRLYSLIADLSGGAFHYNSDFNTQSPYLLNVAAATPDIVVAKTHAAPYFVQGQVAASYDLLVTNNGAVDTAGSQVTVTDTLPAGLTYNAQTATDSAANGWSCSHVAGTVTCERTAPSVLAAGASYDPIVLKVDVASSASDLINSATVTSADDGDNTNNSSSDPTAVYQHLTVTVTGTGSGTVSADAGGVSACTSSSGTCEGDYADGSSVVLTATAATGSRLLGWSGADGGSCSGVTCTVSMTAARAVTATFTALAPALEITKSHAPATSFRQGQTDATYTLTVTNTAAAAVDATYGLVTVTETAPAGLTISSMTGVGWTCSTTSCTRSDALAGGNASYPTITVVATVASNAAASLSNSVTMSGGGSASDSDTDAVDVLRVLQAQVTGGGTVSADSGAVSGCAPSAGTCVGDYADGTVVVLTASANAGKTFLGWGGACSASGLASTCSVTMSQSRFVSAVFGAPDLRVSKSHVGDFVQGQAAAAFAISVENVGPDASTATTVTVTDSLPAGFSFVSASGGGWSCSHLLGTVTCTRSDSLAAGASYPDITLTVSVSSSAAASVTNTAVVSGGGDTDATDNSDDDSVNVLRRLTVAVTGPGKVSAIAAVAEDVETRAAAHAETARDRAVLAAAGAAVRAAALPVR